MNKTKGFTIIELIVVVAIIAVLAAIVLVSVTSYNNRGKNAAIKGNLSSIMNNAVLVFESTGSYATVCSNNVSQSAILAANKASDGTTLCFPNNSGNANTVWCACSPLKATTAEPAGTTFCVDSTGYKKLTLGTCATRCLATTGTCID